MKKFLLFLCFLPVALSISAQTNIAPDASSIEATFTASWNNLYAINDGVKAACGPETLGASEMWGSWDGDNNLEQQILTYTWRIPFTIVSSTIWPWTDAAIGESSGVAVPKSWYIEYMDMETGEWTQVTLLDGSSYDCERYEANSASFEPVYTNQLRVVLNANIYVSDEDRTLYQALGLTEWEVFSTASDKDILLEEYRVAVQNAEAMKENVAEYDGLVSEINSVLEENVVDESSSTAAIQIAISQIEEVTETVGKAIAYIPMLDKLLQQVQKLMLTTNYPNYSDLEYLNEELSAFFEQGLGSAQEIVDMYEMAEPMIENYYLSQEYSEDTPADYSFLVKPLTFTKEDYEPTINPTTGEVTYPNADSYYEGLRDPEGYSSEGWSIGVSGGTQGIYFYNQRVCWFGNKEKTSTLDIHKPATGLVNGYYTISAEVLTQPGFLSGQHVYASTAAQDVVSPDLTSDGWAFDEPYAGKWERLTTEKIAVYDGTMTFGTVCPSNEDNNTLFATTNFVLNYYGPLEAGFLNTLHANKLQECQDLAENMYLDSDKEALQQAIAENIGGATDDELITAIKNLSNALKTAKTSQSTYEAFLSSCEAAKETCQKDYTGKAAELGKLYIDAMIWTAKEESMSYSEIADLNGTLAVFCTYLNIFNEAQNTTLADADEQQLLTETLEGQYNDITSDLSSFITSNTLLKQYLTDLQAVMGTAETVGNIAPEAYSIEVSYCTTWNNKNSINDGEKSAGSTFDQSQCWGNWQGASLNESTAYLIYEWEKRYTINSVSVWFWNEPNCNNGGLDLPESWSIQYLDGDEWKDVVVADGSEYQLNSFSDCSVTFEPVTTTSLKLVLNSKEYEPGLHAAMGVTEWGVFGAEYTYPNIAPEASSIEVSYCTSWNNRYSINDGEKSAGSTFEQSQCWGNWQGASLNASTEYLTYEWNDFYTINSVSVWFWNEPNCNNGGLDLPESWSIQYLDGDEWKEVTVADGSEYQLNSFSECKVKFEPVVTTSLKLVLNSKEYEPGLHAAMGVTEWEVFGEKANTPDGIKETKVNEDNVSKTNDVYDLSGRKVSDAGQLPTTPGLYILNGKKYLVK